MKQRIYKRLVIGDENEVTKDEILWIDNGDGTVDLKKRNNNGELVSIVKSGDIIKEPVPVAVSLEEETKSIL